MNFDRVHTQNVMPVHLYGVPCEFPTDRRLNVIEDCAEAHYARFADGSPVGSRGQLAVFSFYANKIVTTGEGGMVLTDYPKVAKRLRSLRAHAFTEGSHFTHKEHAFGCRMTDLQAAIGRVQHSRREGMLARRTAIAERYLTNLADVCWLEYQKRSNGSVWWVFPCLAAANQPITRDRARAALAEAGVETRTWFRPMHQQPHLADFDGGWSYPVADDLYARGFYLPLYPDLTDDEVDYICRVLRSIRP